MDSPTGRCTCFVYLFSLVLFTGANAQPVKCATPNSTEGQCIHLDDCPLLLNMSNTDPLTTDIITYLRRSQCGYTELAPSVCCPVSSKYMPFTLPTKHINRTHVVTLEDRFKPDEGLPGLDICGKQTFENKIFDGQITGIDEFPWMALLEYKKKSPINGHGFACGGALITDRYVLTAAHCASGQNEKALGGLINVRLGEHNIETEKDCDAVYETDCADPPLNLAIEKKIIHPQYDEDNIDQTHDIALLKLAESVSFSDFVRPICLSSKLPPTVHAPGHIQYVAGWGYTEFKRTSPVKLKLQVPLVDSSKCANKYKPFGIRLGKRQICAGGERNKDSCSGDSGGPLMVQAISNRTGVTWYMTGVVSVGPTPCAANGIPGIYTKVYDYMDWILDNIKS